MKTSTSELGREGYRYFETLNFDKLIPFLKAKSRPLNVVGYFQLGFLIFIFLGIGLFVGFQVKADLPLGDILGPLGLGMALTLVIIPLHEAIHGVAYWILGARDIRFTANWKKFYFTAQAHLFVVNAGEFAFVALAPFGLITLAALGIMGIWPAWTGQMLGLVFIHTLMCGGDFALLSYVYQHRRKGIVTYDDSEKEEAYFLV